jgi:hypothetical protein
MCFMFNCTHSVPYTLHGRHHGITVTIITHEVFSFFGSVQQLPIIYSDVLEELMECGTQATPLHVKIAT